MAKKFVEALEPRRLLSAAFPNANISRMPGNQVEGAVAIDPTAPANVFAVANLDASAGDGLVAGISEDGGSHWSAGTIATDSGALPPACCDPSVSYDAFGNLFLGYLNSDDDQAIVALSTDHGHSFVTLASLPAGDQPTVTSGPGSVWVSFEKGNQMVAAGASVMGPGAVGRFGAVQKIPGSGGGNFGDIAIGPSGQVMVTYQRPSGGGSKVYVNIDADGTGPGGFGKPVLVTASHVAGFDLVPQQIHRGIDAEASLGYDRSGGPFTGRVYMAYTDQVPQFSGNTDTLLRYSDNGGFTWSSPVRVNDDTTLNGQILPKLVVDDTTGLVAVSWHDSRNDLGQGPPGDTNNIPDDDVQTWATLVTPAANGVLVSPNLQISSGTTNAGAATATSTDPNNSIDLGDYTGLDFQSGVIEPVWGDNSNSTGDNPDGSLRAMDLYTATAPASAFSAAPVVSLGGLAGAGPMASLAPTPQGIGFARQGSSYTFTVNYASAAGVDRSTLGNDNILVTGPNGFTSPAALVHARFTRRGTLVTYRVAAPAGAWKVADDGAYTIVLQSGAVKDTAGTAADDGALGYFTVDAAPRGAAGNLTGPRHRSGGDPDQDRHSKD